MDELRIRRMTEDDIEAVCAVRVRGWQWAYAGLVPQHFLDGLDVEEEAQRRRELFTKAPAEVVNLVAERAGSVTGWAAVGPYRDETTGRRDDALAELYALYVMPEQVGTGIGRALMTASLDLTRERGYPGMRLWVLEHNVRARRFYERAGFAPDGAEEAFELAGVLVPEVRYARSL
ncbi:GNAT family N-acetyltransferase [Streptomyces olivaceiscleroticus]